MEIARNMGALIVIFPIIYFLMYRKTLERPNITLITFAFIFATLISTLLNYILLNLVATEYQLSSEVQNAMRVAVPILSSIGVLNLIKGRAEKIKLHWSIGISSFIGFLVVIIFIQGLVNRTASEREFSKEYDRLKEEISEKYPEMSEADARDQYAQDLAQKKINEAKTIKEKESNAVSFFFGYWYGHTIYRPEYCLKLGVDITPYKNAFIEENIKAKHNAEILAKRLNYKGELLLKNASYKKQQFKVIKDEMKAFMKEWNMDEKAICEYYRQDFEEIRPYMSIHVMSPPVGEVLASVK